MLHLALLLAVAVDSPLPLGELPPQPLAANGCALVLWERATKRRVAMATPSPGGMLVFSGGRVLNLPEAAADGDVVVGFARHVRYGAGPLQVEATLEIVANDAGSGGAIIRDGVITVTGSDGVAVVAPVAGIVGCGR